MTAIDTDRFLTPFQELVRKTFPGMRFVGTYEYKCSGNAGPEMSGVCTAPELGMPDIPDVTMLPSICGGVGTWGDGTLFYVQFANGKESSPVVIAAGTVLPKTATLDATEAVKIGPTAPTVELGGGGNQVSTVGGTVSVVFPPTMAVAGTLVPGGTFTGVITIATPGVGIIQTGSSKVTAGL